MNPNVTPTLLGSLRVEHPKGGGVVLLEGNRLVTELEEFEEVYWCDDLDLELLLPLASGDFPAQLRLNVVHAGRFAVGPFSQIRAHDASHGIAALTFAASISISEWDGQLSLEEYLSRVGKLANETGEFVVIEQDFYENTKLMQLSRRCSGGMFADEVSEGHRMLADIVEGVHA